MKTYCAMIFTTHRLPTQDIHSISPTNRVRPEGKIPSRDASVDLHRAFWLRGPPGEVSFGSSKPGDGQDEKQEGEDTHEPDLHCERQRVAEQAHAG